MQDSAREALRPSEEKEMYLPRLSIGKPILSKTENGVLFFNKEMLMAQPNYGMAFEHGQKANNY